MIKKKTYPLDVIISLIFLTTYLILNTFQVNSILFIFGIIMAFFIPGFLFTLVLFPTIKQNKQLHFNERFILSVIFSLAIISLVGIGLNYTLPGITSQTIVMTTTILSLVLASIAWFRWYTTEQRYRFSLIQQFNTIKKTIHVRSTVDRLTTIIVVCTLVLFFSILLFYLMTPLETEERFTEFYILNHNNTAYDYPVILKKNHSYPLTIGLSNYEQHPMNYSICLWLVNQTREPSTNEINIHQVWFLDELTVVLQPEIVNTEGFNPSQWEYSYPLKISQIGEQFKLYLLLYHTSPPNPSQVTPETFPSTILDTSYRSLHLWVSIAS